MEGTCTNCGKEGNWCQCDEEVYEEKENTEFKAQLLWQDSYHKISEVWGSDFLEHDHSMDF